MPKPFNLKPLQDLSRNRLDDAARELGRLVAREREGADKLVLLKNYRAEYEARFRAAIDAGIGMEAFRNYSAFISRIDEAIEIQLKQVEQSKRNTLAGQALWVRRHTRSKAFDALEARHAATENRLEARREQLLTDEHASRKVWQAGVADEDAP